MLPCHVAWFGKQWEGFRSSLDGSGLNAPRTIPHSLLRNQDEQVSDIISAGNAAAAVSPGDPNLQRVLEAELTWQTVGEQRGLRHRQSNEIVGQ